MEEQLYQFIVNCLVELACNDKIDHRNYSKTGADSTLKTNIKLHNMTVGIEETIKEVINDEFYEMKDEIVNETDKTNKHELKEEFFNYFVSMIGLLEINNLHEDAKDNFKDEFESIMGIKESKPPRIVKIRRKTNCKIDDIEL